MKRTEILAAAAAAAHMFRRMLGAAVVDREGEVKRSRLEALDESTVFLLTLELLKLSDEFAEELDLVYRNKSTPHGTKRRETETDLFWLGHHLLDREISAVYELPQGNIFMDLLMKQLCMITTYEQSEPEANEIREGLIARACATREDYSRFEKIYPDEQRPVIRTLLWEFTKSVALNYRGDYRDRSTLDVFGIILTYSEAVRGLLAESQ